MIFNCPHCSAGHSVPMSMIPSGGVAVTCRRCTVAFHVSTDGAGAVERTEARALPIERTFAGMLAIESTSPGEHPPFEPSGQGSIDESLAEEGTVNAVVERTTANFAYEAGPTNLDMAVPAPSDGVETARAEPTRIGVANPLVELMPDGLPLMNPLGTEVTPTHAIDEAELARRSRAAEPSTRVDGDDRPTTPIDLDRVESARAVATDVAPARAPAAPESAPAPRPRRSEPSEPANVYDRIAAGAPVAEASLAPPEPPAPRERAWNEPSARALPAHGAALSRFAEGLNRAPLPLKVGAVAFPLALGFALFATAPRARPVEERSAVPLVEPSRPVEPSPPPATKPAAPAPRDERDDAPAPEGHAFVQVERARLRVQANGNAPQSATLALGQLVRRYDQVGEWLLVMAPPDGPAGFLSEKLVGPMKPIGLLARERAFTGCVVNDATTRDDCLYDGKRQSDACLESCGLVVGGAEPRGDPAALRCAEACKVAFGDCSRACNESEEDRRAGRKRRPPPKR